jgi:hypothetical protein
MDNTLSGLKTPAGLGCIGAPLRSTIFAAVVRANIVCLVCPGFDAFGACSPALAQINIYRRRVAVHAIAEVRASCPAFDRMTTLI